MINDILDLTLQEIENGFRLSGDGERYVCAVCGAGFERGEVFKVGERFFGAEKAARQHVASEHGSMLDVLMSGDKKYTGITAHQKNLLRMMAAGMTDADIASETKTSVSTVRSQRFTFREKAKQAKLFLAVYELVLREKEKAGSNADTRQELIDIHAGATMVDERYMITKAEEEAIVSNMFYSLEPLRLKLLSPKEKKKIVILKRIAGQFERGREYGEKEINDILSAVYDDYATLRRYLIEYGFMDRTKDGAAYWLK
jgi:hypothetical protein